MKYKLELFYWWLLKKSGVFRYNFRRHLDGVLFDLQSADFEDGKEAAMKKYLTKRDKLCTKNS